MVNQQSPTLKPNAVVNNFSVFICVTAAVTAAKTFDLFSLEEVFSIHDKSTGCLPIDVATDSCFDISLKTDTKDNRGVREYFLFTWTTILPKSFFKGFLSNMKN